MKCIRNTEGVRIVMSEIVMDCVNPSGCENPDGHLYWNPQKGLFHCFRCGFSGTTEELMEAYEEVHGEELDLDNIKSVNGGAWRDIDLDQPFTQRVDVDGVEDQGFDGQDVLPDDYQMIGSSEGSYLEREAINYLEGERGISKSRARYYQIGYGTDETMGRLIIPILDHNGHIVYWVERKYLYGKRRYNNPSNSEVPEGRADVVFGLNQIPQQSMIYITEGIFDAISVGPQAVALLGKELSDQQQYKILSKEPRKVIMLLDAEAKHESIQIGRQFEAFTQVEWVMLDEGDPDDLSELEKIDHLNDSKPVSFQEEIDLQLRSHQP